MEIVDLIDEAFVEYKKPYMLVAFPHCTFKCDRENGTRLCHNSPLALLPSTKIDPDEIANRYMKNDLTHAIVFEGLEPFDSTIDMLSLVAALRKVTEDDIVIYTGYYPEEVLVTVEELKKYKNIIIKFGRFVPNQEKHRDEVLGVDLASKNQFAVQIS